MSRPERAVRRFGMERRRVLSPVACRNGARFVPAHTEVDVLKSLVNRVRQLYVDYRYGAIDHSARVGKRGEQAAARLLRRQGLVVVAESESDRGGEIDLIAVDRKRKTIIFVEVKTHSTTKPGHPADRVDDAKQGRVTRAAMRYLKRKHLLGMPCRFDVIAVWWPGETLEPERIEHYEAAFEAAGDFQMY